MCVCVCLQVFMVVCMHVSIGMSFCVGVRVYRLDIDALSHEAL